MLVFAALCVCIVSCDKTPDSSSTDKKVRELESEVQRLRAAASAAPRAADKTKYVGKWRRLSPIGGSLTIRDNGANLVIYDDLQRDTFTATIESSGELSTSHGVKMPYIISTNHLVWTNGQYEKISDQPDAQR